MTLLIWLGFLISLTLMIIIARKNLWLGFIIGALVLGVFNLSFKEILSEIQNTLTDPSILLLALAVGLIPLIGGTLEDSGLMDDLVNNIKMKRKLFLMFGPAFLGMLPMPGGALLSAPLVLRAGLDISGDKYTAINVWFRHTLILIYPLGDLLVTTKMANLNLYIAMLYLIPGFVLMVILGYVFLLRGIDGRLPQEGKFNLKKFFAPFGIILSAPIIHIVLMSIFKNLMYEVSLTIAVLTSLMLAFYFGKLKVKSIKPIVAKMKPWKFFLIIIGMFLFLNIFQVSNISKVIADIVFCKSFLIVGIAAFLGFVTGRVQMPFAILLPIYYSKFGSGAITYLVFGVMFFSTFMGYIISPIHPCVSVSLEFFGAGIKDFFKQLALPVAISLFAALVVSVIL
jgi:integral membrane protein (TIGR00529 family)